MNELIFFLFYSLNNLDTSCSLEHLITLNHNHFVLVLVWGERGQKCKYSFNVFDDQSIQVFHLPLRQFCQFFCKTSISSGFLNVSCMYYILMYMDLHIYGFSSFLFFSLIGLFTYLIFICFLKYHFLLLLIPFFSIVFGSI